MAKKILIVDDEPAILKALGIRLMSWGYQVIQAQSGSQALQLAESEKPDLAILDIMMPDMDGIQVNDGLKKNEATKNIPVIFLTALKRKADESALNKVESPVTTISKPFDADVVKEQIEKLIGVHE